MQNVTIFCDFIRVHLDLYQLKTFSFRNKKKKVVGLRNQSNRKKFNIL